MGPLASREAWRGLPGAPAPRGVSARSLVRRRMRLARVSHESLALARGDPYASAPEMGSSAAVAVPKRDGGLRTPRPISSHAYKRRMSSHDRQTRKVTTAKKNSKEEAQGLQQWGARGRAGPPEGP